MNKSFILDVQEDKESGDFYIQLPEDLLKSQNWKIGDTLTWTQQPDGSFLLQKKD